LAASNKHVKAIARYCSSFCGVYSAAAEEEDMNISIREMVEYSVLNCRPSCS
jgi:hypothetical protein